MNLYVGNLPYSVTEESLREMFSAYGTVVRASMVTDRETGRSKGFGFVQMSSNEEGTAAMSALNGTEQGGRKLTVNEARPREEKPRFNRDRG